MPSSQRAPAGPRGALGAAAETAVSTYLRDLGWTVLGRNLWVGRDEIDILAREPVPSDVLVVLEVRARSRPGFGAAVESVDGRKVARLYRAAWGLRRWGHPAVVAKDLVGVVWRVDLVTVGRMADGSWQVERHLRGLQPP
jgi:Holliday junction resolvase-like predicted endonuclease